MAEKQQECPSCALDIDDPVEVCPYCGYEFPRERSGLKAAAILMALLMAWPLIKLLQYLFG